MTEKILHELFHALLPLLAAHLDYVLTALLAAFVVWVRASLQVSAAEAAVAEVEVEAYREARLGQKPESGVKKTRAMKRVRERENTLLRPREARLDKLIERAWKKQQSAK
jgi:hypothetical protein